jgi:membrane fusion protein (multidrug efflux system)
MNVHSLLEKLVSQAAIRYCAVIGAMATLSACGAGAPHGMPGAGFAPQVTVVTLQPRPVNLTRELPGQTNAHLVADVRPQVSGIVEQRLFTEGALVKAGQPLYELDERLYRAQYNSAKAALQRAQATLAAAQLAGKRSAELVKIDAVSAQDNDNAVAALAQAQADVASAQATVDSTATSLAYAHISAPISGRIGKSTVTPGALVTANQTAAMATIQQLDPIYVDVSQSSREWLQLRQEIVDGRVQATGNEAPVEILLINGSRYDHDGKLQFAEVTVDPNTGDYQLRALVPNPDGLLLPGMYVRAVLSEGVLAQGLLVPQQAITRDPKGNATALIVNHDGKVEPREVKVSRTVGNQWLVDDGLVAGDRLIVEGLQKVQPGMAVKPVEATAASGIGAGASGSDTTASKGATSADVASPATAAR